MPRKSKMQKLIESQEKKTKEEFYQYIIDSLINGQYKQADSLFNSLPMINKSEFFDFLVGDMAINVNAGLQIAKRYFSNKAGF